MRRRDFLKVLSGAVISPQLAHAQSGLRTPRPGFLGVTVASSWTSRLDALRSGLRRLGYEQDKNIVIEDLWAEENYDRLPALAAELVRRKVDIILTYGTPGTLAAKRATKDIPIVFVYAGDAVGAGLVTNLSRPEANVTGNTYFLPELMAKRLELLKDTIPHVRRVAVLVKPDNPLFSATLPVIHRAADALTIELQQIRLARSHRVRACHCGDGQKSCGRDHCPGGCGLSDQSKADCRSGDEEFAACCEHPASLARRAR